MRGLNVGWAVLLWQVLTLGCAPATLVNRFPDIDARVRGDLGIADDAPRPTLVLVDTETVSRLDAEVRGLLRTSGGGLYDPNRQIIYLDASRPREETLYHELVHHYYRYMSDAQRNECLARLYEAHATLGSFPGCPAALPPGH